MRSGARAPSGPRSATGQRRTNLAARRASSGSSAASQQLGCPGWRSPSAGTAGPHPAGAEARAAAGAARPAQPARAGGTRPSPPTPLARAHAVVCRPGLHMLQPAEQPPPLSPAPAPPASRCAPGRLTLPPVSDQRVALTPGTDLGPGGRELGREKNQIPRQSILRKHGSCDETAPPTSQGASLDEEEDGLARARSSLPVAPTPRLSPGRRRCANAPPQQAWPTATSAAPRALAAHTPSGAPRSACSAPPVRPRAEERRGAGSAAAAAAAGHCATLWVHIGARGWSARPHGRPLALP